MRTALIVLLLAVVFPVFETIVASEISVQIEPGLSTLFIDPEDTPRAAARISVRDRSSTTRNLDIRTMPQSAQVYVNQEYIGRGPVRLENLESGTYRIRVSQSGYYTARYTIVLDDPRTAVIEIDLRRVTGYLSLSSNRPNTQFLIDGEPAESHLVELPVGTYTLRARKFGYRDAERRIQVSENATTRVSAELSEAPFEVRRLRLSRTRLNPANPGVLGRVQASFEATNVGTALLEVIDEDDEVVWRHRFPEFDRRDNSVTWAGVDQEDRPVPDGAYRLRLTGRHPDGTEANQEETRLRVDSTQTIRYRSTWSGAPGLLYAGNTEVLPARAFQFSSIVLGHRRWLDDTSRARIPVQAALRVGLPLQFELGAQATAFAHDEFERNYISGGAYLRKRFSLRDDQRLTAALTLSGTGQSYPEDSRNRAPDTATNPAGFRLSAPFELRLEALRMVLAPELAVSPARPDYDDAPPGDRDADLGAWGYLRGGVYLDLGAFQTGASVALRSEPFDTGALRLDTPLAAGLEAHVMVPRTQIVLSAFGGGEFAAPDDYYLFGGLGLGIVH